MLRILRRAVVLAGVVALTLLGVRAYDTQRGEPLEPWHTFVPNELDADEIDRTTWNGYLEAENAAFEEVRVEVTEKLDPSERLAYNRYFDGSPVYPGHFDTDWNHSYVLEPDKAPAGVAVFLHGLTDAPYSMRNIARRYQQQGFVCVVIRLPGHGTVPGGLTAVQWQDWMAATRLAVREGVRRSGPGVPLQLIGYSNGGALALSYALTALDDKSLPRPDRLILISPMVGVTAFARFAGLAALPAMFPAFARAAWITTLPEFNPFKYNSFPVNAARQSYLLTDFLQGKIRTHARQNGLADFPPVLTFQSVVDFTVSTEAIVGALYSQLPSNGSELVLFDINRSSKMGLLLRPSLDAAADRLLPPPPRRFTTAVVTNGDGASRDVVERGVDAGTTDERTRELHVAYPQDVFSLSHVALPFPTTDPLYGLAPEGDESFGISLGTVAARGERGALIVSLDWLLRINSNPFFAYMSDRIAAFSTAPHPTGQ